MPPRFLSHHTGRPGAWSSLAAVRTTAVAPPGGLFAGCRRGVASDLKVVAAAPPASSEHSAAGGTAPPKLSSSSSSSRVEDPNGLAVPTSVHTDGNTAFAAPEPPPASEPNSNWTGKLCLLGVALLWGSYAPSLRVAYQLDGPPGPVAIMLFRGVLQATALFGVQALVRWRAGAADEPQRQQASVGSVDQPSSSSSDGSSSNSSSYASSSGTTSSLAHQESPPPDASIYSSIQAWLSDSRNLVLVGGIELGLWNFGATAVQTLGLQLTSATRATFLIQLTSLFTPVLASVAGERPSRNVWFACCVALAGCLLIAADKVATDADDGSVFAFGGDAAILTAALFYSLATVRLSSYARQVPSIELAVAKSATLASAAVLMFLIAAGGMLLAGDPLTDMWPGWRNPTGWAILVWSAWGPGALAAFLHAKGQSTVPAAEAQVIFSTVPLWSVAFAFVLLGGEPISDRTWVGGAAVVAAGLLASVPGPAKTSDKTE